MAGSEWGCDWVRVGVWLGQCREAIQKPLRGPTQQEGSRGDGGGGGEREGWVVMEQAGTGGGEKQITLFFFLS